MLNAHFVPVYVDGTYLQSHPETAAPELAAYRELFAALQRANQDRQQANRPRLSTGTVHAYVFAADGRAVDSRHVALAGPASVIEMLETVVKELAAPAGEPLVAPSSQSPRPDCADDALALHLTARYLVRRGAPEARRDIDGKLVPRDASHLGDERSGGWTALPSEDWFVLPHEQWSQLLPKDRVAVGDSWSVDEQLTETLLTRFYPTTEMNDLSQNRLDERSLKLTAISVAADRVRARLDGQLKMKHPFYPGRDDNNFVDATILGLLEFDPAARTIRTLQIVTNDATYGGSTNRPQPFGVAVRVVP